MNNKIIVYCPFPVASGVYVNKREKIYPAYTPFRVVHFDGEAFELKKLGKGRHNTVLVSAQMVEFYVPSLGYVSYHSCTARHILDAMEV